MNTTLTPSLINRLSENISNARELQWQMEHCKREYMQTGSQRERAWDMYNTAVDEEKPRDEIEELYMMCEMFDAIHHDAWLEWQTATKNYLDLLN